MRKALTTINSEPTCKTPWPRVKRGVRCSLAEGQRAAAVRPGSELTSTWGAAKPERARTDPSTIENEKGLEENKAQPIYRRGGHAAEMRPDKPREANSIQGHQKANREICVRMQIQANASQEGSVATHLAPKDLLTKFHQNYNKK